MMAGPPSSMRVLFAIVLLLVSATASLAAPNIVVIMTDDQDDTGCMAYMPKTLSLIAQHGVTFKNSFVNLPLCGPSRASFLTGQAAHNHGIRARRWRLGGLQEQGGKTRCRSGYRLPAIRRR